MRRVHECTYDDSSRKSRTQTLREKVSALEAKVRELEHTNPSSDLSDPSSSTDAGSSLSFDDMLHQPTSLALYQANPVSWASDDLDSLIPLVPQEWLNSDLGFDMQNDSGLGSSHAKKASMLLDVSLPQFSAHHSTTSPIPFTDSSGTPVQDGPSDRFLNDPNVISSVEMHNMLFDRSSSATVYQNTPPNPALMSAIYLMGAFFSQNIALQKQLLEQTQQEVARSLHNQDQLIDVIQASYLLAQYLYFNGRRMEGTRHLTTAKRIAFDLGLHQVSLTTFPFDLDYPFDSSSHDWQEKAAILWGLFMVEKFWTLNCDCWEAYAQADFDAPSRYITTPLPVEEGVDLVIDFVQHQKELVAANSPLNAVFDSDIFRGTSLSVTAFKALACCIFDRASRFHDTPASAKDDATWAYHRSSEVALERLSSVVHPLAWRDSHGTPRATIDTDLYIAHVLIHASTIHLHPDSNMNLKISWAAKKVVELVNHLSENDYCYLDPILSPGPMKVVSFTAENYLAGKEQL
ncbi:hypothetical protein CVT25_008350 [Psilocybe cyanescens]|uniref:Xylanolytic transcriptional activator regulatory domain-containing protein n=1 Tax=Psilocybe cyanescens TaxID=93625 RepID=A0A409WV86_PSICY|nr:hypothetical protein CVT25_008350 [Psilocybe cyanescens]